MQKVTLLTSENASVEGFTVVGEYANPHYNNHFYICYASEKYFVFQSFQKLKSMDDRGQVVMPISAIKWLIDTVENKFWTPSSQGGLPKNIYFVEIELEGERIVLQRSMNAGAEGEMGFSIGNKSRPCDILPSITQQSSIYDYLLKNAMFPDLKQLLAT